MYGIPLPEQSVFESDLVSFNNVGATVVSVPHGLGVVPKSLQAVLVCKAAANGFSVGDVYALAPHPMNTVDITGGFALFADAVNISYSIGGTSINCTNKSGSNFQPDGSNWNIRLIATA